MSIQFRCEGVGYAEHGTNGFSCPSSRCRADPGWTREEPLDEFFGIEALPLTHLEALAETIEASKRRPPLGAYQGDSSCAAPISVTRASSRAICFQTQAPRRCRRAQTKGNTPRRRWP